MEGSGLAGLSQNTHKSEEKRGSQQGSRGWGGRSAGGPQGANVSGIARGLQGAGGAEQQGAHAGSKARNS